MHIQSRAEKFWWQCACFTLALMPFTLLAQFVDTTQINGVSIWEKPLKFEFSIILHFVTLAVMLRYLPEKYRTSMGITLLALTSGMAGLLEMGWLITQAARGVASHFNIQTPLDAHLYQAAGVGAVTLLLPTLFLGIKFLRVPSEPPLTSGFRRGAGLGFVLAFVLTLFLAGFMSLNLSGNGHWVGGEYSDAGGLPIFGWARDGGDLRVAHFFALHLMQALPLAGLFYDRVLKLSSNTAKIAIWATALAGVALTIASFMQALAGHPFPF